VYGNTEPLNRTWDSSEVVRWHVLQRGKHVRELDLGVESRSVAPRCGGVVEQQVTKSTRSSGILDHCRIK